MSSSSTVERDDLNRVRRSEVGVDTPSGDTHELFVRHNESVEREVDVFEDNLRELGLGE